MAQALRRHDELLRAAIDEAGGYVFKTVGDAFCAAFATPQEALEAVLAAQRALGAETWPTRRPIRVRMGLHTGVCEERDNDYFGPVVNRAARLEAVAHGGQVLFSGATAELLSESLPEGVTLRDLGLHRLKDLGRAEQVYPAGSKLPAAELPAAGVAGQPGAAEQPARSAQRVRRPGARAEPGALARWLLPPGHPHRGGRLREDPPRAPGRGRAAGHGQGRGVVRRARPRSPRPRRSRRRLRPSWGSRTSAGSGRCPSR